MVSDGHSSFLSVARRNNWLLQKCNFHIIAKILGRRSKGPKSRHRELGLRLYNLVSDVLSNPSDEKIISSLKQLKNIKENTSSTQLKRYLSGFIHRHKEYRTYLKYPELNLPRTSNSAEALIGMIRNLCHRAHGFKTINSLKLGFSHS